MPVSAPRAAKAPKFLPSPAMSITSAWWKCRWGQPCEPSFMTSAAGSPIRKNSRPSNSGALPVVVFRNNTWIRRLTTRPSPRSGRSWGPAGRLSWTKTPAWWIWRAFSWTLSRMNPAESALPAGRVPGGFCSCLKSCARAEGRPAISKSWKNSPLRSRKPLYAGWDKPAPIRSFPPCVILEMNMKPTFTKNGVRPNAVLNSCDLKLNRTYAPNAVCASGPVRWRPSPGKRKRWP